MVPYTIVQQILFACLLPSPNISLWILEIGGGLVNNGRIS